MKTISIDMPDNLSAAIEGDVKGGFFNSELDVLLAALSEFVRRNRIEFIEGFQHHQ